MRTPRTQRTPRPRNWLAVTAHLRKAGAMTDRRAPRGGGGSWRALLDQAGPPEPVGPPGPPEPIEPISPARRSGDAQGE